MATVFLGMQWKQTQGLRHMAGDLIEICPKALLCEESSGYKENQVEECDPSTGCSCQGSGAHLHCPAGEPGNQRNIQ